MCEADSEMDGAELKVCERKELPLVAQSEMSSRYELSMVVFCLRSAPRVIIE